MRKNLGNKLQQTVTRGERESEPEGRMRAQERARAPSQARRQHHLTTASFASPVSVSLRVLMTASTPLLSC